MSLNLQDAIIAGIPLMAVVIGLVQFFKVKLGWSGVGVEVFAIVLGLVFGVFYWAYMADPAAMVGWRFWFEAAVYGLAVGLSATGVYKVGADLSATSK
jgi:hypothetical protein